MIEAIPIVTRRVKDIKVIITHTVENKNERNRLASVIIVNWNGKDYLKTCLESLKQQSYPNFEVIVVDNGSIDGSVEFLNRYYSAFVKVIANKENLGFAGGNNVGIGAARGKYLLLLNNDTEADKKWIEELIRIAEKNPEVGMCASKIYSFYKRNVIDTAGHLIYRDGLNRGRGRLEEDIGQYDIMEEVFFPSGCAALYRKEMLEEIGLFDKTFFSYGDDTDIGLRGRLAGWNCLYVPTAVVYHRYSGSTSAYSPQKAFWVERNRVWILIKYFPLSMILMSPYYTFIRFLLQAYGVVAKKGAAGRFVDEYSSRMLIVVLVKAYLSAIKHLPEMIRKRKEIKKLTKIDKKKFLLWLDRFGIGVRELSLKE